MQVDGLKSVLKSTLNTPTSTITPNTLRTYIVSRSLFAPTTLSKAIETLIFVQANSIHALS
jgi:hypothetical protein